MYFSRKVDELYKLTNFEVISSGILLLRFKAYLYSLSILSKSSKNFLLQRQKSRCLLLL